MKKTERIETHEQNSHLKQHGALELEHMQAPTGVRVFGEIEYKAIESTLGMDGTKEENDKKKQ